MQTVHVTLNEAGQVQSVVDIEVADAFVNASAVRAKAAQALAANVAAQAANVAFLAIPAPTNAQNATQIRSLTQTQQTLLKECSALVRLTLGLLDDTTGT